MLRKNERGVEVFCPHCGDLITVEVVVHIKWVDGEAHAIIDPAAGGLTKEHKCRGYRA